MASRKHNPIIGDKTREPQPSGGCRLGQGKHEPRLAGSRRAADQDGVRPDQHRAAVNGCRRAGSLRHHIAGSRTVKRAPVIFGGPSVTGATVRFSAHRRPS